MALPPVSLALHGFFGPLARLGVVLSDKVCQRKPGEAEKDAGSRGFNLMQVSEFRILSSARPASASTVPRLPKATEKFGLSSNTRR